MLAYDAIGWAAGLPVSWGAKALAFCIAASPDLRVNETVSEMAKHLSSTSKQLHRFIDDLAKVGAIEVVRTGKGSSTIVGLRLLFPHPGDPRVGETDPHVGETAHSGDPHVGETDPHVGEGTLVATHAQDSPFPLQKTSSSSEGGSDADARDPGTDPPPPPLVTASRPEPEGTPTDPINGAWTDHFNRQAPALGPPSRPQLPKTLGVLIQFFEERCGHAPPMRPNSITTIRKALAQVGEAKCLAIIKQFEEEGRERADPEWLFQRADRFNDDGTPKKPAQKKTFNFITDIGEAMKAHDSSAHDAALRRFAEENPPPEGGYMDI